MKFIYLLLVCPVLTSCIPIQIAPKIENYKIKIAKKFKRKLPKEYAFIFEDPKRANEFYHYISLKHRASNDGQFNAPFELNGETFYLSFYETEKTTKTFDVLPIFADAALVNSGLDPFFEDDDYNYVSRSGDWYLVVLVTDVNQNDCLEPSYKGRDKIIEYLEGMKKEYLTTHNYNEVLLK